MLTNEEAREWLIKQNNDFCRYWNNLPKFETPDQIPELPCVEKDETWKTYYVPKLIEAGAIPKKDLIIGKEYLGSCRNSERAIWNGKCFEYERYKWGTTYIDEINHFEDDDGYDLYVPIRIIEKGSEF